MQQSKRGTFIFSLILLCLGVEYWGYEGIITVFRVIILPLSIWMFLTSTGLALRRTGGFPIAIISFFLIYIVFSTISLSGASGVVPALSFLFLVPFVVAVGSGITLDLPVSYSKLFLFWSVPHIFAFIFLPDAHQGWSQRFVGLHGDSNFCGMYLTFSFISAIYICLRDKSVFWKVISVGIFVVDVYLIIKTQSRTTLLTCALTAVALLLFLIKKNIFRGVIVAGGGITAVALWSYAQTLDKFSGAYESPIDNYLVRFSLKTLEKGSGREERYLNNLDNIWENGMFRPIGYAELDTVSGSGVSFSHSSWIDILLASGGLIGGLFLIFVNACAAVVVIKSLRGRFPDERLLLNSICLGLWIYSLLFSMVTGKLFWLSVVGICVSAVFSSFDVPKFPRQKKCKI